MLLLDGAIGAALAARGARLDGPAWSARVTWEQPELLSELHREYAQAGARVHSANTFRSTVSALGAWRDAGGPRVDAAELTARAVNLARTAVPPEHRVAGCLAPERDCYEPADVGSRTRRHHRLHVELLAHAGVDLILCETFMSGAELLVAVEEAAATGLPVWAALSAGVAAQGMLPRELAAAAREAVHAGAAAVLVNCTPASRTLLYVLELAELGVPFGAYANAGAAEDRLGHLADWGTPAPRPEDARAQAQAYAALAQTWVDAGATLVGGCCGTSPTHVGALAQRLAWPFV